MAGWRTEPQKTRGKIANRAARVSQRKFSANHTKSAYFQRKSRKVSVNNHLPYIMMPAHLWKSHSGRAFCFLIQISVHQAQYDAKYDTLSKTPCGQYVGGKRRDLSPKQQKRTLSGTTLHEVHQLLHNSFLLAVEPVLIRKKFLKWQDAHPEFPRIVFHGLRHSSAPYQLMISGGDIKAVQGTTEHASADMLVNTYAHIQQSSRVELGKKFESGFYAKPDTPSPQAVPAAGEPTISMTALLELLKDADPEMKAKLRLALLT